MLVSVLIECNGRLKQLIGVKLLRTRVITAHNVSGLLVDVLMIFSLSSCSALYRWRTHVGSNLIPSAARADEISSATLSYNF